MGRLPRFEDLEIGPWVPFLPPGQACSWDWMVRGRWDMGSRIRACSAPLGCKESTTYPEVKTCSDLCFPPSPVLLSPCWGPWEGHGLHLAAGFSDWPPLSASPLWRSLCEQTPWEWCPHVTLLLVLYFTLLTKHSSRISQNFCARPRSNLTNISWFKCSHCPGRVDQVPDHIVDVVLGPPCSSHLLSTCYVPLVYTPQPSHLSGESHSAHTP